MNREIKKIRILLRQALFSYYFDPCEPCEKGKAKLLGKIKGLEFKLYELTGKKVSW